MQKKPLATHLNKSIKDSMRALWEEWMLSGEQEFTNSDKRRKVSYKMVFQWVSDTMKSLLKDLIVRSFIDNCFETEQQKYHC